MNLLYTMNKSEPLRLETSLQWVASRHVNQGKSQIHMHSPFVHRTNRNNCIFPSISHRLAVHQVSKVMRLGVRNDMGLDFDRVWTAFLKRRMISVFLDTPVLLSRYMYFQIFHSRLFASPSSSSLAYGACIADVPIAVAVTQLEIAVGIGVYIRICRHRQGPQRRAITSSAG